MANGRIASERGLAFAFGLTGRNILDNGRKIELMAKGNYFMSREIFMKENSIKTRLKGKENTYVNQL